MTAMGRFEELVRGWEHDPHGVHLAAPGSPPDTMAYVGVGAQNR